MMGDFYDRLASFRDRLAAAGYGTEARELLRAERSAFTSGEAISSVGAVLQELGNTRLAGDPELLGEVEGILAEADELWNSGT